MEPGPASLLVIQIDRQTHEDTELETQGEKLRLGDRKNSGHNPKGQSAGDTTAPLSGHSGARADPALP
jgi:hypothetical protein